MRLTFLLSAIALFALSTVDSSAAFADVEFKVDREKLDENSKSNGVEKKSVKEIIYNVTVQSKSFKQLSNITVKYMIFYFEMDHGSRDRPEEKSQSGSEKIAALAGNRSVEFQTKPIKLTTLQLEGGWVWASGARGKSSDRVSGVWLRAFDENGNQIGEYASPSSVKQRDWKD